MALQAFKGETVEPATLYYQRRVTEIATPVILHD